jgi:poly-gamma-glutamate synthesis protein (capsule biosynthesis protein)
VLATACVADVDPSLRSSDSEDGDAYDALDLSDKADDFSPPEGPLVFEGACTPGEKLTIAAVGDVLLHGRLQVQAFGASNRYRSLWSGIEDLLAQADVTYANLEGPTARGVDARGRDVPDPGLRFDDVVYTSYPMFNYHPALLEDLQASGVDVVSTANNHSLDRRTLGADRTIEALEASSFPFTGTRRAGEDESARPWYAITETSGFRLGWLACTYGTNGIPDRDDQVLLCFEDEARVAALIGELAARSDIDAVIVTPHWGAEYTANPNGEQVRLGHRMLDAGALAVIGSHPHVLQPWERHMTPDGRETFIIYSLGNFVSGQTQLARRSTMLLYLGLTRRSDGEVVVHGARYVPLHMTSAGGALTLQAIDRVGGLAESRALTTAMFSQYNVYPPGAPFVLDPACDPAWTPPLEPHPHDGWIGGACVDDTTCSGASCDTGLPGGLCTDSCDGLCPDRTGRASTFCVDFGGYGQCVARCASTSECRDGYMCSPRMRFGGTAATSSVCVPAL